MDSERKALPRTIRGGRQVFFEDPAVDKLVAMVLALSGEVWVLRERLAAVEGVAAAAGAFSGRDVERYEFSPAEAEQLGHLRREFIANLFRVLEEQVESARATSEPHRRREVGSASRKKTARKGKSAAAAASKGAAKTSARAGKTARAKRPTQTARRRTRPRR